MNLSPLGAAPGRMANFNSMVYKGIYVDSVGGSNSNDGLSSSTPVQTIANALTKAANGWMIFLKRGCTWTEQVDVYKSVSFEPYGSSGASPKIDGENIRSGIVVYTGCTVVVKNIDTYRCANGVYGYGANAVITVLGGYHSYCGTGIAVGNGALLALSDSSVCAHSTTSIGAGDGIQISQDAAAGEHRISNLIAVYNARGGINHKVGNCIVQNCVLTDNGECGFVTQNDAAVFTISGSLIEGNNTSNNGTFNAAVEDFAEVHSMRNVYRNPTGGSGGTNNLNMVGTSKIYSQGDQFIASASISGFGSHVRANQGLNAGALEFLNSSFYMVDGVGACIDAYGATGLSGLTIKNCAFHATAQRNVRVPDAVPLSMDRNCWYRADAGTFFEIQDARYYSTLAALRTNESTDANSVMGDPLFASPTSNPPDLSLGTGSPCLSAGGAYGVLCDFTGHCFATTPHIGARA